MQVKKCPGDKALIVCEREREHNRGRAGKGASETQLREVPNTIYPSLASKANFSKVMYHTNLQLSF